VIDISKGSQKHQRARLKKSHTPGRPRHHRQCRRPGAGELIRVMAFGGTVIINGA